MDQDDAHWKQKYLTSLDKYEKKERTWKELEELLRLAMTRVALAAEGIDDTLDRQLKVLRKSIRSGGYNGLESIVEEISASVKRLDELRKEQYPGTTQPPAVLSNLVTALDFPKPYRPQVKNLLKHIKQADPDQPIDDLLRQIASLINTALASDRPNSDSSAASDATQANTESGKSRGLLDRWLHSGETKTTARLDLAIETLQLVLHTIQQAINNKSVIDDLNQQLQQADDDKTLRHLTRKITQLLDERLIASGTAATEHDTDHSAAPVSDTQQARSVSSSIHSARQTTSHSPTLDGASTHPSVAGFCLQLIETLQFPHDFEDAVQVLRDKIVGHYESNQLDMAQSAEVLNDIADLISATRQKLEQEKQDLQEFLRQLTDRLKDIDLHLAGAESHSKLSISSRKTFGDMVEAQMKGIETSVQDAAGLSQLKSLVQDRLDAIRNHIVTYQQGEEQTHRQLLDELAKSNARLHDLEMETEQLRARLMQEHAQAIHDKLTGIYNRLAYEERMAQEFQRWKRYKKPLVLLVFDVDHFKSINDTYGHKAGDKALKLIAQTLQKNIRETDFLARYGGEEFVVLMPETDIAAAMGVANKLRESVQAIQFNYQEKALNVTISCGATQLTKDDTADIVFQRADGYLYQAKQTGRNCCYTADRFSGDK